MNAISKVMIFGASGNFGRPITHALAQAGFEVTAVSRKESNATFPPGSSVVKINYTLEELIPLLTGQDAAVCIIGPAGIHQGRPNTIADAAHAAGVKRLIIDDFGWGPDIRGLPEFSSIRAERQAQWCHAKAKAETDPAFTWTGITSGNPIDWALKKFPTMGFDIANQVATIYDEGREEFTGTTLESIGQSIVGTLRHLDETANRFVKVMSTKTCQHELLQAFDQNSKQPWEVRRTTTQALLYSGREKLREGDHGWVLDLVVAQLYDAGQQRCVVAPSREDSDSDLLGVIAETPAQIVSRVLGSL